MYIKTSRWILYEITFVLIEDVLFLPAYEKNLKQIRLENFEITHDNQVYILNVWTKKKLAHYLHFIVYFERLHFKTSIKIRSLFLHQNIFADYKSHGT